MVNQQDSLPNEIYFLFLTLTTSITPATAQNSPPETSGFSRRQKLKWNGQDYGKLSETTDDGHKDDCFETSEGELL